MNGPVTIEFLVLIVGAIGTAIVFALGSLWWIERRIKQAEQAAAKALSEAKKQLFAANEARQSEILVVAKDLADYKVKAAEKFASSEDLGKAEVRLATAIDRLTNRIENLPRQFAEQVAQILAAERR